MPNMTGEPLVDPEDILSGQEIESLVLAQNIYSARAKESAVELAGLLEIEAAASMKLAEKLGDRLAEQDFERRKLVGDYLQAIVAILAEGNLPSEPPAIALVETTSPAQDKDSVEEVANASTPEAELLTRSQVLWLGKVFGEENIPAVEALDAAGRAELIDSLEELYRSLAITRSTPENRENNIKNLRLLFEGKTYTEISQIFGKSKAWSGMSADAMAGSITKRVSKAELLALISVNPSNEALDSSKGASPSKETAVAAAEPLTPHQRRWYIGLLDDAEVLQVVEGLLPGQREFLATRLGQRLDPLIRPKLGAGTTLKVERLRAFLTDQSLEQIAQQAGMTREGVNDDIVKARNGLRNRVSNTDLARIVEEARAFKEQPKDDSQS